MEKGTANFPKIPGIFLILRQLDLSRDADHFVLFSPARPTSATPQWPKLPKSMLKHATPTSPTTHPRLTVDGSTHTFPNRSRMLCSREELERVRDSARFAASAAIEAAEAAKAAAELLTIALARHEQPPPASQGAVVTSTAALPPPAATIVVEMPSTLSIVPSSSSVPAASAVPSKLAITDEMSIHSPTETGAVRSKPAVSSPPLIRQVSFKDEDESEEPASRIRAPGGEQGRVSNVAEVPDLLRDRDNSMRSESSFASFFRPQSSGGSQNLSSARRRHRLVRRDAPFRQSSGKIFMMRSGLRLRQLRLIALSDWFHVLLESRMTVIVALTTALYTSIIIIFAAMYMAIDGKQSSCGLAAPGTDLDLHTAFAFSVETMTTIGYGLPHGSPTHVPQIPERCWLYASGSIATPISVHLLCGSAHRRTPP